MRILVRFSIALLLVTLVYGTAFAGGAEPSIRATVDRRAILIGQRILYKIIVRVPSGIQVEMPKLKGDKPGDLEVKDSGSKTENLFFGGTRVTNWYEITGYEPGKFKTPITSVRYKDARSDDWKAKGLNQIDVEIESVLPKGVPISDIKDIKQPIWPFVINYKLVGFILGAGAILLAGLIILIRHLTRVPPKTPYEIAISDLEEARRILDTRGDMKEYYVKISDCIRRYIESVFALHAPEMTTQEFLDSVRSSEKLPSEYKDLMKDFMEACDLVKFARYVPARKEADTVLVTARNFVDGSKGFLDKKKGGK
jgi:hypothetical protein